MKIVFDTSVLVAAIVQSHPLHQPALAWLQKAHRQKAFEFLVCGHSLVELYAVLTRLPLAPRISPAMAYQLIKHNVVDHALVVGPKAHDYAHMLDAWQKAGLRGGICYDALIHDVAQSCGADEILTLNSKDFARFSSTVQLRTVA